MPLTTIRILLLVCLVGMECVSYQYSSKTDYINSKWRSKQQSSSSWYKKNYGYHATATEKPHPIRHSGSNSRYTKLDGVLNRLGNYYSTTKKPWENTRYHKTDNDDVIDDNYEDLDYNEEDLIDDPDKEDEDKWGDDDDKNDTDYQDGDGLLDEEEWQAEEATETPSSSSSLTDYKWSRYGTRSRVEESRRLQMPSVVEDAAQAAVSHYLRVQSVGRCRIPAPKVISVHSEHPSLKAYIPHCTILHRCSEDSGCCQNHATQCGPKNQTLVHLYFYTHSPGKPPRVEKLPFYNHTECECLDRTLLASEKSGTATFSQNDGANRALESASQIAENITRCKCPGEFVPGYRFTHCVCTCTDGDQDCERMKRGKEHFSLKDRLCIKNGQCSQPSCEYGNYLRNVGRCPLKQEKLEAFASVRPN